MNTKRKLRHMVHEIKLNQKLAIKKLREEESEIEEISRIIAEEMDDIIKDIKRGKINDIGARTKKLNNDLSIIEKIIESTSLKSAIFNARDSAFKVATEFEQEFNAFSGKVNNVDKMIQAFKERVRNPVMRAIEDDRVQIFRGTEQEVEKLLK